MSLWHIVLIFSQWQGNNKLPLSPLVINEVLAKKTESVDDQMWLAVIAVEQEELDTYTKTWRSNL